MSRAYPIFVDCLGPPLAKYLLEIPVGDMPKTWSALKALLEQPLGEKIPIDLTEAVDQRFSVASPAYLRDQKCTSLLHKCLDFALTITPKSTTAELGVQGFFRSFLDVINVSCCFFSAGASLDVLSLNRCPVVFHRPRCGTRQLNGAKGLPARPRRRRPKDTLPRLLVVRPRGVARPIVVRGRSKSPTLSYCCKGCAR